MFDGHVFPGVALLPIIKTYCFTFEPIQNVFNLSKNENENNAKKRIENVSSYIDATSDFVTTCTLHRTRRRPTCCRWDRA